MPRKRRITKQNHFHHIMFRGVNGENVFIDDLDRSKFCLLLQESCEKHRLNIHGFCFMNNHIHLILEPTSLDGTLQSGIHAFAFRYAQFFNKRHKRRGYLFQGRFRSIIVEGGIYLGRLIRYIHLNPVEALITSLPEHYKWSSFRAYLRQDHYTWLQTDRVLNMFGDTRESAIEKLIEYTNQKFEAKMDHESILKAWRKGAFTAEEFICKEKGISKEATFEPKISHISLKEVVNIICTQFNLNLCDLTCSSKAKPIVDARSTLALIVRRSKKWSLEELGSLLNKNSGTLSRLATRAEQQPHLLTIIDEFCKL